MGPHVQLYPDAEAGKPVAVVREAFRDEYGALKTHRIYPDGSFFRVSTFKEWQNPDGEVVEQQSSWAWRLTLDAALLAAGASR